LRWIEWGGPTVTPHMRRGFGTRVIEDIVAGQLNGEVHSDWRDQGLACALLLVKDPAAKCAKRKKV
jgi:two-component sensor histidine kinase